MGKVFEPARIQVGVPAVERWGYPNAQTFKRGAVMVLSGGQAQEGAADPGSIIGVALQPVDTGPGWGVSSSGDVLVTTGRSQETSIARANRDTVFSGRAVNGGTDPVAYVEATHRGTAYGILRTAAGEWVIDISDTVNTRVRVVDGGTQIGEDTNIFYFKFLESALALP